MLSLGKRNIYNSSRFIVGGYLLLSLSLLLYKIDVFKFVLLERWEIIATRTRTKLQSKPDLRYCVKLTGPAPQWQYYTIFEPSEWFHCEIIRCFSVKKKLL